MANRENLTLDEYLNKALTKKGLRKERKRPVKVKKVNNKKKKGLIITITSVALAALIGVSGYFIYFFSKKKENDTSSKKDSYSISALGTTSELPTEDEETLQYGETTGNVDKNKVVEKNGKIYATTSDAQAASKVGTSSIDTKNDTLKVESDGKVYEKEDGYKIVDSTGSVVEEGDTDDLDIVWDAARGEYVKKEDLGKYVYNENGHLVSVEDYEKYKNNTSTTTSSSSTTSSSASTTTSSSSTTSTTTSSSTSSTTVDQGVVNSDGTYTIFGLTFESKEDYQQWVLQGYTGYSKLTNGMMVATTKEMEEAKEKVLK